MMRHGSQVYGCTYCTFLRMVRYGISSSSLPLFSVVYGSLYSFAKATFWRSSQGQISFSHGIPFAKKFCVYPREREIMLSDENGIGIYGSTSYDPNSHTKRRTSKGRRTFPQQVASSSYGHFLLNFFFREGRSCARSAKNARKEKRLKGNWDRIKHGSDEIRSK